ncbi:MAG: hypothetical protein AAGD34_10910 [Pseudomonadota bacterium]
MSGAGTRVAVVVVPVEEPTSILRVEAVIDACGSEQTDTVVFADRTRCPLAAMGARVKHTTVLLEPNAKERCGVVTHPQAASQKALVACCFYHRWMDAKRRAAVDRALESGCGVVMIVTGTIIAAAHLSRELLQTLDAPLQLHELMPRWTLAAPALL